VPPLIGALGGINSSLLSIWWSALHLEGTATPANARVFNTRKPPSRHCHFLLSRLLLSCVLPGAISFRHNVCVPPAPLGVSPLLCRSCQPRALVASLFRRAPLLSASMRLFPTNGAIIYLLLSAYLFFLIGIFHM